MNENLRKHGRSPYSVVVVHGGPGACGEMVPVARELASTHGVLEPMQTAGSVDGQVEELRGVLQSHAALPVTLIGFSWGAWLSWLVAARHSQLVGKLVLVGSPPFKREYAATIHETRMARLNQEERVELTTLLETLANPEAKNTQTALARLVGLVTKADAYDPEPGGAEPIEDPADVFANVWPEAQGLRRTGELLSMAAQIACPVVAIHGDYDPHPAAGVQEPLSAALKNLRFVLLKNCGHKPWIERQARDEFFRVLKQELA